jgi:hypothetical protein
MSDTATLWDVLRNLVNSGAGIYHDPNEAAVALAAIDAHEAANTPAAAEPVPAEVTVSGPVTETF